MRILRNLKGNLIVKRGLYCEEVSLLFLYILKKLIFFFYFLKKKNIYKEEERKVTNKKREVGRKGGCFLKIGKGGEKKNKINK